MAGFGEDKLLYLHMTKTSSCQLAAPGFPASFNINFSHLKIKVRGGKGASATSWYQAVRYDTSQHAGQELEFEKSWMKDECRGKCMIVGGGKK